MSLAAVLTILSPVHPQSAQADIGALYDAREHAFVHDRPSLLTRVYMRDAAGAHADRRTLSEYRRRGWRFVALEHEILAVDVQSRRKNLMVLEVVDRIARARVAHTSGSSIELPRDRATRHVVTVHRTKDGWRIGRIQISGY